MEDHQSASGSGSRKSHSNNRPSRLGEFSISGRSPQSSMTLDDSTTVQNSSLGQSITNPNWGIWGGGNFSISSQMKATSDEPSYLNSASFEPAQSSSSRKHDPWPQKPPMSWPDDTPLSNVQLNDTLSRSPVRLRGSLHDASQTTADIPRGSSPYSFTLQAPVGQSSMAQSPPNNTRGGFLDNTTGFPGGITAGPLSQAYGGSNRLASETAYNQFSNIPPQQPTSHPTAFVPSFPNTRPPYEDLGRDTIQAEVLAQLRQMTVEPDDQDKFSAGNRRNKPNSISQSTPHNLLPLAFSNQQPQFGDFVPYPRQPLAGITQAGITQAGITQTGITQAGITQASNLWSGTEDTGYAGDRYTGGEGGFQEGNRNQNSSYYMNGSATQPGLDSSRSAVSSHQQAHINPTQMLLPRDQNFSRTPYSLPYQYNGIRLPSDPHFQNPAMPPIIPVQPQRRHDDFTHNLRSVLLEEFRSNSKSNKRYELKDIYTHVVEFSGDQHGSRFIQQKLETANSDEKETVFNEIFDNSLQLMTDVFGNYVIQKFFEHGDQVQKSLLAKQMEGHVLTLSLQMYGCRVVQKALEHILVDQQASLVKELDGHVLKCVKDQNGNHVVQKAIERVPAEHIQFIIKAFNGQVPQLATHPYGCRVIQRMLEHCDEEAQASLLKELHGCSYTLMQDQYGNYVTQHVIEHGKPEDRAKIIQLVTGQLLHFSKHKFASNVVEKSIAHGTDDERRGIVRVITTPRQDGSSPLQALMKDQYGNYVIQKLLIQLRDRDRELLVDQIKPQLQALKKYHFGKQINAIEKLIYNSSPPQSQSATPPPSQTPTSPPPTKPATQTAKTTSNTTASGKIKETAASGENKNIKGPGKPDGAPL